VEIRINGEAIQFTIETERTIGDVIRSVEAWLKASGFCVTGIKRDNADITAGGDSDSFPLSRVSLLDFTAKPFLDIQYEQLSTIYQYLTLLKRAIEQENRGLVVECMREFSPVYDGLRTVLGEQEGETSSNAAQLKRYAEEYNLYDQEYERPGDSFFGFIESLADIISGRMNEIMQPLDELRKVAAALKDLIPRIADVSILLQTGKDGEAMGSILRFIELTEKLVRLYQYINLREENAVQTIEMGGERFSDFCKDFNGIFTDITQALSAKDSILIGDLFEYEVAPRIEKLLSFLKLIEARAGA
jgi:hypothetical protein